MFWSNEYCDRATCFALKELGYPWEPIKVRDGSAAPVYYELPYDHPDWQNCNAYYAFTIYEAHTWLRRAFGYHIEIDRLRDVWYVSIVESIANVCHKVLFVPLSYEEASLCGIKAIIKLIKENKDERRKETDASN